MSFVKGTAKLLNGIPVTIKKVFHQILYSDHHYHSILTETFKDTGQ